LSAKAVQKALFFGIIELMKIQRLSVNSWGDPKIMDINKRWLLSCRLFDCIKTTGYASGAKKALA